MNWLSILKRVVQGRKVDQTGRDKPVSLAQYNTYEARAVLSQLLLRAFDGEEIVIARAGVPVAKLVPYDGEPVRAGVLRAHLIVDERTSA
jgi:prevent-host-death family protein